MNRRAYDVSPVDRDAAGEDRETTRAIEADIEQTRVEMSRTIDAIQERLSPQHLADQARDAVYEATIGKAKGAGSTMLETIKQNPLPAAIAALSIGWMFRNSANKQRSYEQYRYRGYYQPPAYQARYRGADYSAADSGGLGEMAGNVKDQVQEMAGNVKDQVQHMRHEAMDQVEHLGEQARYQADQAADWAQDTLNDNPLMFGAVALALGAAVGLALPNTPVENRVMGEARDSLVDKVQETASEAMGKVQEVTRDAAQAVQDAVGLNEREQGASR